MSVHIHTIDINIQRHRDFLNQRPKDVFTQQELKAGDDIVFCEKCKSPFLVASWQAMDNRHRQCNNTEVTLAEFPTFKIKFTELELKREIESLTIQISQQEPQIESLRSQNKRLELQIESLRNQNKGLENQAKLKTQEKQIKTLPIFRNCLISMVLGLGVFSFYQYRNINNIKTSNFYLDANLSKLKQQNYEISQNLDTLDSNLSEVIKNSDCYADESQFTDIEHKIALLESRQKCLIQKHNQYKKERDRYTNILSFYPLSLSSGQTVEYSGYLYSHNNDSNAIIYNFYVPYGSYFNICLCNFKNINGQFQIINEQGESFIDSKKIITSSSYYYLNNYYLSSGRYTIKVWNNNSTNSSSYFLRIYSGKKLGSSVSDFLRDVEKSGSSLSILNW